MRIGVLITALAGSALAAYLVVHVGIGAIVAAIGAAGWAGFAILCVYGAALFALLGTAWFALLPKCEKPNIFTYIWGRAVRDCAGEVLPFSQVGGMVIGARAIMLRRVSPPLAFASTIVDVTVETIAQIAFVLAGLSVLIIVVPHSATSSALVKTLAIGVIAAAAGAAIFVVLQQRSFAIFERWAERLLPRAAAQAGAVHRKLAEIHASPLRLAVSAVIHMMSWIATALWAWIAIRLIGRHLAFTSVLAIEAILYAIRSIIFVVPGGIGIQEAAYAVLGPMFGLSAPVALAISLLKRARDIALGIPVLLAWQIAEGGHALRASRQAARMVVDE